MNVTVIGSLRSKEGSPWPLRNEEQFAEFCQELGIQPDVLDAVRVSCQDEPREAEDKILEFV